MSEHNNDNKIRSQDVDWSAGTNWSNIKFLKGDGTWDTTPAIPITGVTYVSKNGNDSTGLVERLDKPFLTLAGAKAAVIAWYDGINAPIPSPTNKILIYVFTGYYTEKIVLANYVDWNLTNSIIDLQTGSNYTIDDNGVACNSIIYGNSQILRSTAGTLGTIRLTAVSNVKIYANNITTDRGSSLVNSAATLYIYGDIVSTVTTSQNTIDTSGTGTTYIYGNITNGITNSSQSFGALTFNDLTSNLYIYGNITTAGGSYTPIVTGTNPGILYIQGNLSGHTIANYGISLLGTQTTIIGNISSNVSNFSCVGLFNANASVGNHIITGNIINSHASGFGVIVNGSFTTGTLTINNSLIQSGSTPLWILSSTITKTYLNNCTVRAISTAKNAIIIGSDTDTLIIKDSTLLATTTGQSISGSAGKKVTIYGTCQANSGITNAGAVVLQGSILVVDSTAVYGVSVGTIII